MHPRAVGMLLPCVLLLGACGDGAAPQEPAATPPDAPAAPQAQAPLAIPSRVPLRASSDGDPDAVRVIRRWTEALRRGDLKRASALWAVPAILVREGKIAEWYRLPDDPAAPQPAPAAPAEPAAPIV